MINSLNNYTLNLNLNRISPYYLYSEAVSTIMNPTVRSVNAVTVNQLVGAISGYLGLGTEPAARMAASDRSGSTDAHRVRRLLCRVYETGSMIELIQATPVVSCEAACE